MSSNFKVAFIGYRGLGRDGEAVLGMIKDERTNMAIHSGDFDYQDAHDRWERAASP